MAAAAPPPVPPTADAAKPAVAPYLARMVFEDTLRLSGYVAGMTLMQKVTTGQVTYQDKLFILGAGFTGSLMYHVFLNPMAESAVRPSLIGWAATSAQLAAAPSAPK
jgi:hypothetical protein